MCCFFFPPLDISYSNVTAELKNGTIPGLPTVEQWWELQEVVRGDILDPEATGPTREDPNLSIVAFNDRVAPAGFSFFTGYGYVTHTFNYFSCISTNARVQIQAGGMRESCQ